MLDSIFGGVPGMNYAKLIVLAIFMSTLVIILVFSWIPMSNAYPAYAADKTTAPAWWTGLALGINLLLLNAVRKL